MRGKFVTFEGCEGVGKSTQLRLVKEDLARAGVDAVFTREPGGTAIAEKIRSLILDPDNVGMDAVTELLLYAAARRQHTMELIEPALAAGKTVFCDRYIDSTFAYQGFARGLDLDVVHALETIAMGDVQIDLTIFLDVDPSVGFARKGGADPNNRLERENAAFFQKVYEGFRRAADENERIVAVSAPGTKYDRHETIMRLLRERGIV